MNLAQHRHTYFIDNQALNYLDIGQGPVLLLGHNYLFDSNLWAAQLQSLSQHYRCIVPDLWGHGRSANLPGSCYALKHLAEHYLQLMDSLEIHQFSIIGQGIGGMWGTELTLMAPQRVQALVMLGSFIGFEPEVTRAKYQKLLDGVHLEKAVSNEVIDTLASLIFAPKTHKQQPELIDNFKASFASLSEQQLETLIRIGHMIIHRRDMMEQVEQLTLPTLIMTGTEDKICPIIEGYLMHDAISGSQYIHLQDAGHIANLELTEEVAQRLLIFFSHALK
ncbi:alpha/beta hydrolase [Shewanella sp. AS1]|uniref:alpha/beta fold hydrolase n=1 Tax=Shewanella sp. AS1 TaxID=2907626 RepID=UPI001F2B335B|nr:alpha/beta fold hydrolase [Shewanella sp. AS1]MCE9678771.1 alpha/beta hydrolase [Shewanella sp. AS1]